MNKKEKGENIEELTNSLNTKIKARFCYGLFINKRNIHNVSYKKTNEHIINEEYKGKRLGKHVEYSWGFILMELLKPRVNYESEGCGSSRKKDVV